MAATRVYILAKKLGVKSSAIVEKCKAEDLDINNHMSTISAGLAATICEWFSEGEHTTTVETAKKVDLSKVRVKRKKKPEPEPEEVAVAAQEGEPELPPVEEPPVEEVEVDEVEQAAEVLEPQPVEPEVVADEQKVAEQEEQPEDQTPETEQQESKEAQVATEPEDESQPEPVLVKPAGPINKPKPAVLNGPKVVRIEAPEPERPARRPAPAGRGAVRSRRNEPVTQPLMPAVGDAAKKGKGKERTHGRRRSGETEAETKKTKFDTIRRKKDMEERKARLSAASGTGMRLRPSRHIRTKNQKEAAAVVRPEKATVSEPITVKDLSAAIAVKGSDIVFKLMQQGTMATINQVISTDIAEVIALEYGTELTVEKKRSTEDIIAEEFKNREKKNLESRPVIATMLGHVDHGKTSLLDEIRSAHVASGEAGGITQHISTYQVTHKGKKITFLDTPGHAAFTELRARGANMTDVVILVVAADDGVMPQTIEVINHAKAADVKILIALNKMDLPGVDINKIYSQLSEHELVPAEWGGDIEIVKTSAATGEGLDDLLEHLEYIAELLELKADDTVPAIGRVVEASISPQKGVVATLLVQEGILKKGDVVLAGKSYGRVKVIKNTFGKTIKSATSSTPVVVTGLDEVPQAGERFYCLGSDISKAKSVADENKMLSRESSLAKRTQITMENLFSQIEAGGVKELNIILRADVQGSVDVLVKYLNELSTEEVKIKILGATTGGITEGDVVLAEASNALLIGFNVIADERASRIAESKGVEIRLYTIIYRITEDLEKSMVGMLEPERHEELIGKATIRNTFKVSKLGTIAGCYVTDGVVRNKAAVHLIRNNVVVRNDLQMMSLKHFKDDVREVKTGLECGIKFTKFDDVKMDDMLEFYETVEVAKTLR